MKKGGGKYCSKACLGKSKRNGSDLYCEMCDSVFYRRFGEQDRATKAKQFCGRACYSDWRTANMKAGTYPKVGGVHAHRVVAEAILGRPLKPGEVVHHVDENRHNLKPSNLAVLPSQSFHVRVHQGTISKSRVRLLCLDKIKIAETA